MMLSQIDYIFTKEGIVRPFVPERDLIRLIKYGTCDLLELDDLDIEEIDSNELSMEELDIIALWYIDYAGEIDG